MDRRDTYIFTHYSDIAEAKNRDVRNLQAKAVRSLMLGMCEALIRMVRPVSSRNHDLKQSGV